MRRQERGGWAKLLLGTSPFALLCGLIGLRMGWTVPAWILKIPAAPLIILYFSSSTFFLFDLNERWRREFKSLAEPAGSKELELAERVFFVMRLLVPSRLRKEDEGDALEIIGRLVEEKRARALVYLKLATSTMAILWAVLREVLAVVGHRAPTGKG